MREYNIDKLLPLFKPVKIQPDQINKLNDFVNELIKYKQQETAYKTNNANIGNRFFTGLMGEIALENYLGIKIVDWTIGMNNIYNIADLNKIGLNIGIKTSKGGN